MTIASSYAEQEKSWLDREMYVAYDFDYTGSRYGFFCTECKVAKYASKVFDKGLSHKSDCSNYKTGKYSAYIIGPNFDVSEISGFTLLSAMANEKISANPNCSSIVFGPYTNQFLWGVRAFF